MSETQFYLSLGVVVIVFGAMIIYIIKGKIDQKRTPSNAYRWRPEQDYDVVLQGETPMTPGFPVLKKRDKPGPKNTQGSNNPPSKQQ